MSRIAITSHSNAGVTLVPDLFIDAWMPQANGEFVKIYLYLLRCTHLPDQELSLSSLADVFSCTENDILRALRYWEKSGLLRLSAEGASLTGIELLPCGSQRQDLDEDFSKSSPVPVKKEEPPASPPRLSAGRVRQLQEDNEEVRQLLFLAEQYLGRTLSSTDANRILYFYDGLHFPMDLIEYLIEYCVSRGSTSLHYIEKVGLEWHKDGVSSVSEAKARTSVWNKNYFSILKAFGIRGRNPVSGEVECMKRWLEEYGFSMELIQEACARTVSQTGQPSFQYAEGILGSWKRQKVCTLEDVKRLDQQHRSSQKSLSAGRVRKPQTANRFNNFHQREYDYSQLEKQLLEKQLNE